MACPLLSHVSLRIPLQLMRPCLDFYQGKLGMQVVQGCLDPGGDSPKADERFLLRFPASPESAGVELVGCAKARLGYHGSRDDLYWKIGVALDDVDAGLKAVGERERGSQFLDVGYLRHIADPAGFAVELLQTTFEDNRAEREKRRAGNLAQAKASPGGAGAVLGAGNALSPVVGQVTIRTADIQRSMAFYKEKLGMKLICIEKVKVDFELYFLAFTDDEPPNTADLHAVVNREWCYQRGYTTLEIQCAAGGKGLGVRAVQKPEHAGCEGIVVAVPEGSPLLEGGEGKLLRDPDGLQVKIMRS